MTRGDKKEMFLPVVIITALCLILSAWIVPSLIYKLDLTASAGYVIEFFRISLIVLNVLKYVSAFAFIAALLLIGL